MPEETEIQPGEYHPAADDAMQWFKLWKISQGARYLFTREAIAGSALAGNRLAQICGGTLDRLDTGQSVSDRYLLGLCWFLKLMEERAPAINKLEV